MVEGSATGSDRTLHHVVHTLTSTDRVAEMLDRMNAESLAKSAASVHALTDPDRVVHPIVQKRAEPIPLA
jgi:hypothetical protein